jgi:hypothetical protein
MTDDETISIQCRCGELSLQIKGLPVVQLVCHCNDCREATNLPSVGLVFFESTACTSEGNSTPSEMKGSSGYDKSYYSCASCGTLMYGRVKVLNNAWAVVADHMASFEFEPQAHIWTSEKITDVSIPESTLQSPTGPPDDIREVMISAFWGER